MLFSGMGTCSSQNYSDSFLQFLIYYVINLFRNFHETHHSGHELLLKRIFFFAMENMSNRTILEVSIFGSFT